MRSSSSSSRCFSFAASLFLLALAAVACAEEKAPEASNPGGVGPGSSGSGGAAGGAGGSGGASAGAGGADVGALPDVAGCSLAAAVEGSEIGIATDAFKYTPACLKVKVGAVVTFKGGGALHPLAPMTKGTTADNPIPLSQEPDVPVTFSKAGVFPYFCENHGSDGGTTSMVGAVYVVP